MLQGSQVTVAVSCDGWEPGPANESALPDLRQMASVEAEAQESVTATTALTETSNVSCG